MDRSTSMLSWENPPACLPGLFGHVVQFLMSRLVMDAGQAGQKSLATNAGLFFNAFREFHGDTMVIWKYNWEYEYNFSGKGTHMEHI